MGERTGDGFAPRGAEDSGEDRARIYLELAGVMFVALDSQGRIELANRKAAEVLEADQEAMLGADWFGTFIPIENRNHVRAVFDRLVRGELEPVEHFENEVITSNGKRRLVRWHNTVLYDEAGRITGTLSSGEDVTEHHQAIARLRESEERFRQMADMLPAIVGEVDLQGRLTYANKLGLRAFGLASEELEAGLGYILEFIHPDDRVRARDNIAQVSAGEDVGPSEYRMVTKDGREFPALVRSAPIERDGRVIGIRSTVDDLTTQKELQARVAQADRLTSMGLLAAGVAHEINNPLAYVLYNLESLAADLPELITALRRFQARFQERLGPEAVEELAGEDWRYINPAMLLDVRERFEDALEGTTRIRDVTRGLGSFARVERDQLVPVDLGQVMEAALNMARNEIKYRARLETDFGRVPTVLASEGRLSQVFLNLIINAVHAIEEGDVDDNELRLRTWAEGDEVCAQVRDTGRGISPEHLDRLFDPFFTTKEVGVGSGLGLAISRNIVEGYGGRIEVDSQVEQGTRVTVRIPLAQQASASGPGAKAEPDVADGLRGRILLVDDEEGLRSAIARMLGDHEVIQASGGQAAKALLEADQSFDVILCDMMMPELSGMELHAWLAGTHPDLARRLIFITGGAFTPRARDYLQRVDNLRLDKPFDPKNLRRIVADMVESARR